MAATGVLVIAIITQSLVGCSLRLVPDSGRTILLSNDGRTLYVANPDSGSVSVLDVATRSKLAEIPVGKTPRTLSLSPDESRLLVACQESNHVAVVDTTMLRVHQLIPVSPEPYGVVTGIRGHFAYVTSAAAGVVDIIQFDPSAPGNGEVVDRIPVEAKPAGVARSASGRWLYVTHLRSGRVSVIDWFARAVVDVIDTGGDSNTAQRIAIHPQSGRGYLPHIRSNVSNRFRLFDTTLFPAVSVLDLSTNSHLARERIDLSLGLTVANLPFDVTFSPDGAQIYITNLGSGDVMIHDLDTGRRVAKVDVGHGPRGMAVSPDGSTGYVNNSLTGDVSIIDLVAFREIARIPVTDIPYSDQIQRGKIVFFSSQSPQIARDRWMSCASCHPEGEHDGRTWFTELGPRNTTSVRGAGQTRPLHWSADRDEVQDFEHTIRSLQAGSGLLRGGIPHPSIGAPNAGRSADLDALAAYVDSLHPKASPSVPSDSEAMDRGRDVFMRSDVGCSECHVPPRYTDSTIELAPEFIRHDVGTGGGFDERFGPAFDTPSLRGLWDSAPFLHDGSARTLGAVLIDANPTDRHGRTSHLTRSELDDLVAFLLSL